MGIILFAIYQHRNHGKRRQYAQRDAEPRPEGVVPLISQESIEQCPSEIDEDDGHKKYDVWGWHDGLISGQRYKISRTKALCHNKNIVFLPPEIQKKARWPKRQYEK